MENDSFRVVNQIFEGDRVFGAIRCDFKRFVNITSTKRYVFITTSCVIIEKRLKSPNVT